MAVYTQRGNDFDLGTFTPSLVNVDKRGWYDAYDNSTATTLAIVLGTKHKRKSLQKVIVTLGATTNVTCAAATQSIGIGSGKTAGDYLLTLETEPEGVLVTFTALD